MNTSMRDSYCQGECIVFNNICMSLNEAHDAKSGKLNEQQLAKKSGATGATGRRSQPSAKSTGHQRQGRPVLRAPPMPPLDVVFHSEGQSDSLPGEALHNQPSMRFWQHGYCKFESSRGSEMGPEPVSQCMSLCLNSPGCIAATVGGTNAGTLFSGASGAPSVACMLYSGSGKDFSTVGGEESMQRCYRKVPPGTEFRSPAEKSAPYDDNNDRVDMISSLDGDASMRQWWWHPSYVPPPTPPPAASGPPGLFAATVGLGPAKYRKKGQKQRFDNHNIPID